MKYESAPGIEKEMLEIVKTLDLRHVDIDNVSCIRSYGSKARGVIARCHALGKVMQKGMGRKAFYVLEFISRRFDKMDSEQKTKTIIHELMHIPYCFGGGFKHHDVVTERNVNLMYKEYKRRKNENNFEI